MKIFKTLLIGIAFFIGIFFASLYSKISLQEDFYLLIEPGMSMNDISIILKSKDVIYMPFFLNQFSRISGKSKKIKAPALIYQDLETASSIIRDLLTPDIEKIIIDSKKLYRKLQSYLDEEQFHLTIES